VNVKTGFLFPYSEVQPAQVRINFIFGLRQLTLIEPNASALATFIYFDIPYF
jgi:hypothetical protein